MDRYTTLFSLDQGTPALKSTAHLSSTCKECKCYACFRAKCYHKLRDFKIAYGGGVIALALAFEAAYSSQCM